MKQLIDRIIPLAIQIAILMAFNWLGSAIAHLLHSSVPGSLIGMALLLTALCLKIFPLSWIEQGGNWLLSEMILLYIPSTIGIVQYPSLIVHNGVKLLAAITLSTLSVMVAVILVTGLIHKIREIYS